MWNKSILVPAMMVSVGCTGMAEASTLDGSSTADQTATDQSAAIGTTAGGFQCLNKASLQVACVGQIAVLPITINIKNVRILNNSELFFLNNDLNNLAVLDAGILNGNDILEDVEVTVLDDFLNLFKVVITDNVVNVCTNPLGIQFCK